MTNILKLTASNYYGTEANVEYVSVSQYKDFIGTPGRMGCEARALATVRGEYSDDEPSTALMVGSYVDAYFEGEKAFSEFIEQNPQIFSSRGESKGKLKSEYKQANVMIERAEKDPLFMAFLQGEHQVIMTGEIEGVPVKCKFDSLNKTEIVDLKTVKNISETFFIKDSGERVSFVEYWGYDLQGAVYREIYRQNTGEELPFYIAAISKDKHPRLAIIEIPPLVMEERLTEFRRNITKIQDLKNGIYAPSFCKCCDFCADRLPLTGVITPEQLITGARS